MQDLIKVGVFPEALQAVIDTQFRCHDPEVLARDDALRRSVKGIITRSNCRIPTTLIDRLPSLKVIATSGVGYDGIPVAHARKAGVTVTNTPGVLDDAVCELAVGLLLAMLRDIPASDRYVRSGDWRNGAYSLTASLAGKRVGIVGLGRIGSGIASRLAGFKVDISYAGSRRYSAAFPFVDSVVDLARQVDILVVSCPGGAETFHLIDGAVLEALGPQGYLVNVSRGTVVDEAALAKALTQGQIRAAALDVFENEPLVDSPLTSLPNVILSPHAGSATRETRQVMLQLTLDNLKAVLEGRPALTPVDA
jgi:lactate dehydrogenase-like 2-hydroxyacid dehydrogenase